MKTFREIIASLVSPANRNLSCHRPIFGEPVPGGDLERLGGNPPDPNQAIRTPEAFPLQPEDLERIHEPR